MTREELEERLSALEAQHQRDIALLTAAHAARVRSLLSLWQPAAQPVAAEAQPGAARRILSPSSRPLPSLRRRLRHRHLRRSRLRSAGANATAS
jgi:hypothetical protein